MNWNDLPVFLAIADSGSLNGAARRLGVNHSTVFRRLNALEAALSTTLFDRQSSGYLLTPTGERLREFALEADRNITSIERELAGRDLEPTGRVRLATAAILARTIVPNAVRRLRDTHPGIEVDVAVSDDDYDLSRREADLALRATTRPPEHFVGRKVADVRWQVCAARSLYKKPQSIQELSGYPLIGAEPALLRIKALRSVEDRFGESIVARANDLPTMVALAAMEVGLAVLPSDHRDPAIEPLFDYEASGGESFGTGLWLLTHPDMRAQARVKTVWDAIDQAVKELGFS